MGRSGTLGTVGTRGSGRTHRFAERSGSGKAGSEKFARRPRRLGVKSAAPGGPTRGPFVGIQQQFVEALSAAQARGGGTELLPVHLARAVASTLGVDGVGLSIHGHGHKRTPLGA